MNILFMISQLEGLTDKKYMIFVFLINPCIYISEIGDGKYNYTSLLNNLGDVNPELFGKSTKRCNSAY